MDELLAVYPDKVLQHFRTLPKCTLDAAKIEALKHKLPSPGLLKFGSWEGYKAHQEGLKDELFEYATRQRNPYVNSALDDLMQSGGLKDKTAAETVTILQAAFDAEGAGDHTPAMQYILDDAAPCEVEAVGTKWQGEQAIDHFVQHTKRISAADVVEGISATAGAFLAEVDRLQLTGFVAILCRTPGTQDACFAKSNFVLFLLACAVQPRLKALCRGFRCCTENASIQTGNCIGREAAPGECYVSFDDGTFSGLQIHNIVQGLSTANPTFWCLVYADREALSVLREQHHNLQLFAAIEGDDYGTIVEEQGWNWERAEAALSYMSSREVGIENAPVFFDYKIPDNCSSFPHIYSHIVVCNPPKKVSCLLQKCSMLKHDALRSLQEYVSDHYDQLLAAAPVQRKRRSPRLHG